MIAAVTLTQAFALVAFLLGIGLGASGMLLWMVLRKRI